VENEPVWAPADDRAQSSPAASRSQREHPEGDERDRAGDEQPRAANDGEAALVSCGSGRGHGSTPRRRRRETSLPPASRSRTITKETIARLSGSPSQRRAEPAPGIVSQRLPTIAASVRPRVVLRAVVPAEGGGPVLGDNAMEDVRVEEIARYSTASRPRSLPRAGEDGSSVAGPLIEVPSTTA
jgi:hypothetical protein